MTTVPSQLDFQRLMTCEIEYVCEFIDKFGMDCRDPENNGTGAHWAALNPNLQILYSFAKTNSILVSLDKFGIDPIGIACRVIGCGQIRDVFCAGLIEAGKRGTSFTTEDVLAIGLQEQKKFSAACGYYSRFNALMSAAAMSDVEFLEFRFGFFENRPDSCEIFLHMFCEAIGNGRWGLKSIPFLVKYRSKLRAHGHACYDCTNIYSRVYNISPFISTEALTILIETDPEFNTGLHLYFYRVSCRPSVETICLLHLASIDAKCVEYLKKCKIRTSKLDERCGVFAIGLIRKRITELSFALSDLPALIICEIAQAHCTMWPRARFCHYWRIVTTIKHKR